MIKAKHIYPAKRSADGEFEDVDDLFCIQVEGQRQDSLYHQLKDLQIVADNIGCYDASDYLTGVLKEIKDRQWQEEPTRIPLCYKCSDKIIQPDLLDKSFKVVGCQKLTQQEWEKGQVVSPKGIPYQKNCPIFPID